MRIFTGNANPKLAEAVCRHLNTSLGRCVVGRFSDGEVLVELLENVRGRDVFQPVERLQPALRLPRLARLGAKPFDETRHVRDLALQFLEHRLLYR